MTQEIEIEFKNLLSQQEFENLLNIYAFPKEPTIQTNYYFDTTDFKLKKRNAALRIRKKEDQLQLTLKEPHHEGLLETHDQLTMEEAKHWINGNPVKKEHVCKRLNLLNVKYERLQCFGQLETERREIKIEGSLFVLDKSKYNNIEDYEMELEVSEEKAGKLQFKNLLKQHNIPKRKTGNKIERLFINLTNN